MARRRHPDVIERVNNVRCRCRRPAGTSPALRGDDASLPVPNDGGPRINNLLPDWPTSLEGFAKKAYEFYDKELKPLGFKVSAQVISYEGGVPGNVAMYLKW